MYQYQYFKIQNKTGDRIESEKRTSAFFFFFSFFFCFFLFAMILFNKYRDDTFKTTKCVKYSISF